MEQLFLNGSDWHIKEFVGMDWVWRDSVKPETKDVRWWIPATVPGSALADVWRAGQVPDPYFEMNSKLCEWVSARTWVYRKRFCLPAAQPGRRARLCFEGVDYDARVFLNGQELGAHTGMYTAFSWDVTDVLVEGENLLAVVVERAPDEQPQVGKTSLVHTHKSRMTYWWDFCPRLIHQGIWDSVRIEWTGEARFADVWVSSELSGDCSEAVVTARVEAENADGCTAEFTIAGQTARAEVKNGRAELSVALAQPRLWQPNGCGTPDRYEVRAVLIGRDGAASDERTMRHGIRRIEWEQNERAKAGAPAFVLRVNGRRVYIKGYNWVPIDVMYGVERPEKLARLIELAKDAHVNFFRVWGGGLIEKDSFYEACADAGILVWQEFILSSSGIDNKTPADPAYREMLVSEAEQIIRRKRNHAALAAWCGGNELQSDDGMPLDSADPVLAALKQTVARLDPGRRWLPTSPSGGVFINSIENIEKYPDELCDVHGPWEHQGLAGHCELYNRGTCLIHTEFGVEGMTNPQTLGRSVAPEHRLPANKENPVYFHRGSWWTNEELVQSDFGGLTELDDIRRASQFMQYEGLKYAVECDRRRAFHCSGTFPWQFNEPYPNCYCTSNVDYYADPKPAYYGVRKAYAPELVSASFGSPSFSGKSEFTCEVWATSDRPAVRVRCELLGLRGERLLDETFSVNPAEEGRAARAAELAFSENYFLLLPGETRQVEIHGGHPGARELRVEQFGGEETLRL